MKLINIGYGNYVSAERLLAVVSPDSAPIKRIVQDSREIGMLIDATYGRKTQAVLIMDTGHAVLSALPSDAQIWKPEEMQHEPPDRETDPDFRAVRHRKEHRYCSADVLAG